MLWARRNPQLKFLGGFHGFPGGKMDESDRLAEVTNCPDAERAALIACAVRETFEETGVLLARGGRKLTKGQRKSLHTDLIGGVFSFPEILRTWGLRIDARDFIYRSCWTTPEFSPLRFKTRFFLAVCPPKQKPYPAISELEKIEFIEPAAALRQWAASRVLIAPPVLASLRELAREIGRRPEKEAETAETNVETAGVRFERFGETVDPGRPASGRDCDEEVSYIELNSRLICLPLRTKTLPPATHTNCFVAGSREFVVIDPASPEKSELEGKLFRLIDELIGAGGVCREIIVSHLHPDHYGGELILKKYLQSRFGLDVPVAAHRLTAESLRGKTRIDRYISDGEIYRLRDGRGEAFQLETLHTPGHARGHLCFYDRGHGFLLSSDNVVGLGTVVIAPPEGNMRDYLVSLERMRDLPGLNFLCGSHGAACYDAVGRISSYIDHRLERERQVLRAVRAGAGTPAEIVSRVYDGLRPELVGLAEKSVEAHLEKLRADGLISP